MSEFDVLISYAPHDRVIVSAIAERLRDAGVKIWFDQWDLMPGMSWADSVDKVLGKAKMMLQFIGTRGYTREERSWVSYESTVAVQYHMRSRRDMIILPVLLPGATSANLPSELVHTAFLTLDDQTDETLNKLVSLLCLRLTSLVKRTGRPKIFLCHSKQDDERVAELYFKLRDEGFDPWYDKEKLDVGDRWEDEIITAIENTDFFAVCLSARAVNKEGFLQKELRSAIREFQRRSFDLAFLLPIRLEECEVPNIRLDENTSMRSVQWADLFSGDNKAFARFIAAIWKQWDRKQSRRT